MYIKCEKPVYIANARNSRNYKLLVLLMDCSGNSLIDPSSRWQNVNVQLFMTLCENKIYLFKRNKQEIEEDTTSKMINTLFCGRS